MIFRNLHLASPLCRGRLLGVCLHHRDSFAVSLLPTYRVNLILRPARFFRCRTPYSFNPVFENP
jgi:hypothetical protein